MNKFTRQYTQVHIFIAYFLKTYFDTRFSPLTVSRNTLYDVVTRFYNYNCVKKLLPIIVA